MLSTKRDADPQTEHVCVTFVPHCSKRRAPEIDDVVQQLSNMPFCSEPNFSNPSQSHHQHQSSPPRQQQQPSHHQQQRPLHHASTQHQFQHQQQQHQGCSMPMSSSPHHPPLPSMAHSGHGSDSTSKRICTNHPAEDGNTSMSEASFPIHQTVQSSNPNVDVDLFRGLTAVAVHLPLHRQLLQCKSSGACSPHLSPAAAAAPSHSWDSTHQQHCTSLSLTSSPSSHSGSARRILKSRRPLNVNDMVKASISDALFSDC